MGSANHPGIDLRRGENLRSCNVLQWCFFQPPKIGLRLKIQIYIYIYIWLNKTTSGNLRQTYLFVYFYDWTILKTRTSGKMWHSTKKRICWIPSPSHPNVLHLWWHRLALRQDHVGSMDLWERENRSSAPARFWAEKSCFSMGKRWKKVTFAAPENSEVFKLVQR